MPTQGGRMGGRGRGVEGEEGAWGRQVIGRGERRRNNTVEVRKLKVEPMEEETGNAVVPLLTSFAATMSRCLLMATATTPMRATLGATWLFAQR